MLATKTTLSVAISLICCTGVIAGSLDAPHAPNSSSSAMFHLEDVYNRLNAGAPGIKRSGPFSEPKAGPAGTGHTLDEVMGKAPAVDDKLGVEPSGVLAGKNYWGLRTGLGWGPKTGTMPNNGTIDLTPAASAITIPKGYHSGAGVVKTDADLIPGNIKGSVEIFGVTGTAKLATGDAVAEDVLTDKTFSNSSGAATGSMPDIGGQAITPAATSQTITKGYHDGTGSVAGDANLATGNIKSGTSIFGVAGKPEVVDTESGDAAETDIAPGKKAWVGGIEITGTAALAPVPNTGQTTCYSETGTVEPSCTTLGQDADTLAGVAWPNPRFTVNGDGTVTDNLTNLVWLENANCFGTRNWATALTDASGLANLACDLTDGSSTGDWHLPNTNEFQSIVNYEFDAPPPLSDVSGNNHHGSDGGSNDAFTDVQQFSYYWSSTTFAQEPTQAWALSLANGDKQPLDKVITTPTAHVWPVKRMVMSSG